MIQNDRHLRTLADPCGPLGTFRALCCPLLPPGRIGALSPHLHNGSDLSHLLSRGPLKPLAHGIWSMSQKTRLARTMIALGLISPSRSLNVAGASRAHVDSIKLPSPQGPRQVALRHAMAAPSHATAFQFDVAAHHDANGFAARQKQRARRAFFRAWIDNCARRRTIAHEARIPSPYRDIADSRPGKVVQ